MIDPPRALAPTRREARLRRTGQLRQRAAIRRISTALRASTSRSSAPRRTISSPTGRARASGPCDPVGELPARPSSRGEDRCVRRVAHRRLRRRARAAADPARTHAAIEDTVGEVLDAGRIDRPWWRSLHRRADMRACAKRHRAVGLVHFDTHTDTGTEVFGVKCQHGTPMCRLVRDVTSIPSATRADRAATGPASRSSAGRRNRASPRSSCMTCAIEVSTPSSSKRSRPSAAALFSSRSTSTCSIPPSRQEQAHRSPAG